jgi:hypothetical protein
MTHDKKQYEIVYPFSPVSLIDTETSAQLESTLEKVVMQSGKEYLSAVLEENHDGSQSDKSISSAPRNSTPGWLILGWMCSSPCV